MELKGGLGNIMTTRSKLEFFGLCEIHPEAFAYFHEKSNKCYCLECLDSNTNFIFEGFPDCFLRKYLVRLIEYEPDLEYLPHFEIENYYKGKKIADQCEVPRKGLPCQNIHSTIASSPPTANQQGET